MEFQTRLAIFAAFAVSSACAAAGVQPEDWTVHAQSTFIDQWHGDIRSPYSGPNSLDSQAESAHTWTVTAFLGRALWTGAGIYFNPETSQGSGLSGSVGVAGFPNGEATHGGAGNLVSYTTARLFLRQTFGLGGERERIDDDQNQLSGEQDVNRVTVTVGKFAASDLFDGNAYAHDPRTQFLNWSLMDNAAWDYPANAKGYTGGAAVEWNRPADTARYGFFLEPAEANGFALDYNPAKSWGQVLEWEHRYSIDGHAGTLRPLVYWNRTHMGGYAEALQAAHPDVTLSRSTRSKAGGGISWDQEITGAFGAFGRVGYSDGRAETWAFTEVDRAASGGLSWKGAGWGRADDTFAVAAAVDGLSSLHRRYLAAGGEGFIVGDGRLRYGTEDILEAYYNYQAAKWLLLTLDYQYIGNPGYNRDRGPVSVLGFRLHAEY